MDGRFSILLLSQVFSLSQMVRFTLRDFTTKSLNYHHWILAAVRLGFWLCQFNVGVGVMVMLVVVLFIIVSVCSPVAQPTQKALNQK
jgi:hypothetical protein